MVAQLLMFVCLWDLLVQHPQPNAQKYLQLNAQLIKCTVVVVWILVDAQCLTLVCPCKDHQEMMVIHAQECVLSFVDLKTCIAQDLWIPMVAQ